MSELMKFESLLRRAAELEAEVRVVPMVNATYGDVEFYAHIQGHDSDTVDMTISNGPRLAMIQLQRGADGLRGEPSREISAKAASFTRDVLE